MCVGWVAGKFSLRFELFYSAYGKLSWSWDVAAGLCILTEAGGVVAGGKPGNWEPTLDCGSYLAVKCAPSGQKETVKEFWNVIGDEA
jgi:myo-inositol-1(or 4)-monophosphatase